VRRLLSLATSDGLELAERVSALLNALPKVDWIAAHALAEDLSSATSEQRFETFFDLLQDAAARLTRAAATGEGEPEDLALARRLIPEDRLASWAEVWETIVRDKAEALALNLDRKALILDAIQKIAVAARMP